GHGLQAVHADASFLEWRRRTGRQGSVLPTARWGGRPGEGGVRLSETGKASRSRSEESVSRVRQLSPTAAGGRARDRGLRSAGSLQGGTLRDHAARGAGRRLGPVV